MYSNNRCNGVSKRNSKKVVEQGADYCLALKNNHKIMYQEVESFFQKEITKNIKDKEIDFYQTIDKGHGEKSRENIGQLAKLIGLLKRKNGLT